MKLLTYLGNNVHLNLMVIVLKRSLRFFSIETIKVRGRKL